MSENRSKGKRRKDGDIQRDGGGEMEIEVERLRWKEWEIKN